LPSSVWAAESLIKVRVEDCDVAGEGRGRRLHDSVERGEPRDAEVLDCRS